MSKNNGIDERLLGVKEQLAGIDADLGDLSSAIWHGIDHDDPAALEEGVRFKQRFNEKRVVLEAALASMVALLQDYPGGGPGNGIDESALDESPEGDQGQDLAAALSSPMIAESAEPGLSPVSVGDLSNRLPFGFELNGRMHTCATAWPLFYEALLEQLYARSAEKLSELAEHPERLTYGGKILFARLPDKLDDPLPVADALFAEVDFPPEELIGVIQRLLPELGISTRLFKILVKEKNRGTVETLSIAA